jgi:hypothetical protein
MTNSQTKATPKTRTQLFGVIKIRDVWLNELGDGPSLIWDNKAGRWRRIDEQLHDLMITWGWPFGRDAKMVGSESWGKDLFPFVIDYYIAIRWELIEEYGLEWAVVDRLEASSVMDLPFIIDVYHDELPIDALELGND